MTTLIVWRHGETAWNAASRVQGQCDIPLSEVGLDQAAQAAERIAALGPVRIVSSDLERAAQTANALSAVTGLEVTFDQRLRERHYGPWQGLTRAEIVERWPEEYQRWRSGDPAPMEGIESVEQLGKRVAEALAEFAVPDSGDPGAAVPGGPAATGGGQTIVVATHGSAALHGCCALLGWPYQAIRTLSVLGNCRWSTVRYDQCRGWGLWAHNVG